MSLNRRLPSYSNNHLAMVPRGDVPRSTFHTQHTHKTTFNAGPLIPFYVDEVIPGDSHKGEVGLIS